MTEHLALILPYVNIPMPWRPVAGRHRTQPAAKPDHPRVMIDARYIKIESTKDSRLTIAIKRVATAAGLKGDYLGNARWNRGRRTSGGGSDSRTQRSGM
jgi:hypothetical protein